MAAGPHSETAHSETAQLETARLVLRRWRADDHEPFAALNADPLVMEHLPATLSRAESDTMITRIEATFDERGFGLWAVEARGDAPFVGFVGLTPVRFDAHFTPAVEVGWRLDHRYWGRGYATEAARAAVEFGFESAGLAEIVSFTVAANTRSQRVMERLGMSRDPADDFDHPGIPSGSPFRRLVLYRIRRR